MPVGLLQTCDQQLLLEAAVPAACHTCRQHTYLLACTYQTLVTHYSGQIMAAWWAK